MQDEGLLERSSPIIQTAGRGRERAERSLFSALLGEVKAAGLLRRRRGFYVLLIGIWASALAACILAMVVLGGSWTQLIVAVVLGVVFTQLAFLAHEAGHRQIFASAAANERASIVLGVFGVGLSQAWWTSKHSRHHANPNTIGKDPDIEKDTISFLEEDAAASRGLVRILTRRQGYLFFPLLLLEGVNLHRLPFATVLGRAPVPRRWFEIGLLALRFALYLGLILACMPLGIAVVFLCVQLAVFGLYMGASFAPNHKGMPVIPRGARVDFFSRQVLTSRDIRGGWFTDSFMGGLNYQVEHHLFPSMPRPALRSAQRIVRAYCTRHDVPYTEVGILESYGAVIRYLNRVGLAARDPFDCPMVAQFRRRD